MTSWKAVSCAAAVAACLTLSLGGAKVDAAELGATDEPIKLALNEWTGQHITTRVAGEILQRAGYQVEYVTAGYFPQFTALADGEPGNLVQQHRRQLDQGPRQRQGHSHRQSWP